MDARVGNGPGDRHIDTEIFQVKPGETAAGSYQED